MKELSIHLRVRNNRMLERRRGLGFTQEQMALAVGVDRNAYSALESLRKRPIRSDGEWVPAALRLAEYFDVDPAELFPAGVLGVTAPTAERTMDAAEAGRLMMSQHASRAALAPDIVAEAAALDGTVARTMEQQLTPREALVLRMRFGMDDGVAMTFAGIAEVEGVSLERVRQIERKAIGKLRGKFRVGRPKDGRRRIRMGFEPTADPKVIRAVLLIYERRLLSDDLERFAAALGALRTPIAASGFESEMAIAARAAFPDAVVMVDAARFVGGRNGEDYRADRTFRRTGRVERVENGGVQMIEDAAEAI